jgi:phosphatidylserine/phosphatidylglycerophosphate/cardiolipin synthase-like enzyme
VDAYLAKMPLAVGVDAGVDSMNRGATSFLRAPFSSPTPRRVTRFMHVPLAGLLLLACIGFYATADGRTPVATPAGTDEGLAVYFSPKGGCTEAIVEALGKAKQAVLVQAYSFTSTPIAKALVDAHKRDVKVTVVLDKSQETEKYSSATFVANAGIRRGLSAGEVASHPTWPALRQSKHS